MAQHTQTYANHAHRPTLWLVAALAAVGGFALIVLFVLRAPGLVVSIGLLLLAIAVVCLVWMVRSYALRLQDRIIRLEMENRLARLGRLPDMQRLTLRHLVALRFAPDAELPGLIDRTIAEGLTVEQIKRAVTNWQGDYLRT